MGARAKRKRQERARAATRLEPLKREMQKTGLLQGRELLVEPPGEEKMSGVILQFIEPYRWLAEDFGGMQRLVMLAVVAWNAAVFDALGQPGFVDQMIASALPPDEAFRRDFRQVVNDLIQRKQQHFADTRRIIVSYKLTETQGDYHLAVASTLAEDS
jgi:hypothetical protein